MQANDCPWSTYERPTPPGHSLPFSILLALKIIEDVAVVAVLVLGAGFLASVAESGGDLAADASSAHRRFLFFALVMVVEIGFLTGVWMKKKWGAFGHVLFTMFAAVWTLHAAGPCVLATLALDGILTWTILVKWSSFE
jgi:hypothetical protein